MNTGPFATELARERMPPGHVNPPRVSILEGMTVQSTPSVAGAEVVPGRRMRAVLQGASGAIRFDDSLLSRHVLFLGGIGTGKTNAMMQLVQDLRGFATADDVFVIFDTKGDFLEHFYRPGDTVISNQPGVYAGEVNWNLFSDITPGQGQTASDEIFEIASTVFSDDLARASQNYFFAAGARDIFGAVIEALSREGGVHTNAHLRTALEDSNADIWKRITSHPDLAGNGRYLAGGGNTPESVRAFLQQTVNSAFSGNFRLPGDFSVRRLVRDKGAKALFIEYDIAVGSRLLPIYRVLVDLAIKEALSLGRRKVAGNVFFVMDEFALLPQLMHISDGINFGRSLGLRFVVATQNVEQVLHSYGPELGRTILSGFGTVFAFRVMDDASRAVVQQRFGSNRKQVTTELAVRSQGVKQDVVMGNVVEDWVLSGMGVGECLLCLPYGAPFRFPF